jgi:hypothetical protein
MFYRDLPPVGDPEVRSQDFFAFHLPPLSGRFRTGGEGGGLQKSLTIQKSTLGESWACSLPMILNTDSRGVWLPQLSYNFGWIKRDFIEASPPVRGVGFRLIEFHQNQAIIYCLLAATQSGDRRALKW